MKFQFKVSTQVSKIVGMILLVCGLQLFGQQTASGEDDAPKPPKYIKFDLPASATGPVYIQAMAINPAGAIAGYYSDSNSVCHGFLRARDGTVTTFDAPGAGKASYPQGTFANGITPAAAISGYYIDTAGNTHGFLRAPNGTYTTFDSPPGSLRGHRPSRHQPGGSNHGILFCKQPVSRLPADSQGYLHHIRFPDPGRGLSRQHLPFCHQPGGGNRGILH
jgi:hypothetical protein